MKGMIPLLLVALLLIAVFTVQEYFKWVGPGLARQSQIVAEIKEIEKRTTEKDANEALTEKLLRRQATTNMYIWFTLIVIVGTSATVSVFLWKEVNKRKESWHRQIDGVFPLHTVNRGDKQWIVNPNNTVTAAIAVDNKGDVHEQRINPAFGANRQLALRKTVQTTATAIAVSNGNSSKYAAPYKFLSGLYERKGSNSIEPEETEAIEPVKMLTLQEAVNLSDKTNWIIGQSKTTGKLCKVNIFTTIIVGVLGAPNVGKTASTGLLLAYYARRDGMNVVCLDAKGGIDWVQYDSFFDVQETNENVFPYQFKRILDEFNIRQEKLKTNNWTDYRESKGEITPTLIIIEEFGYLMERLEATDKRRYDSVLKSLTSLLRVARMTGLFFVLIDQTSIDWPSKIVGITKLFIAYRVSGAVGNAVKLYALDSLAEVGEFTTSAEPKEKFTAWFTGKEIDWKEVPHQTNKLLPSAKPFTLSTLTIDAPEEEEEESVLVDNEVTNADIILSWEKHKSLNKVCRELFGKTGGYYTEKVKPILVQQGLYNG